MTYQEFCRLSITPLTPEEWASDVETIASTQEIQWRQGFEVLRAIRHRRAGRPTVEDLRLIAEKTNIVIGSRDYHRVHSLE